MNKVFKSVLSDNSRRLVLLHKLLQKKGVNTFKKGIMPRDRSTNSLPLSYAQQRLWFLNQLEPESPSYNIPAAVRLRGQLNVRVLEGVLGEIVRRHEVLRTTFPMVNGRPFQSISAGEHFTLPLIDLAQLPEAEKQIEALRLVMVEAQRPFDLVHGPLLRASVVRLAQDEHVLSLCAHHIVFDGRSIVIFFRELTILYAALSQGKQSPLPELTIQYADYAAWQREWLQGKVLDRQIAYWKQQLAGATETLSLPTDCPRPEVRGFCGAQRAFSLTTELSDSLRTQSRLHGVTLFMTLLTSWLIVLSYHSRQEDISIGADIANRNQVGLEELIGFFANQLVLRVDLRGNQSFRKLLGRVRTITLGAYAHQDLPFEQLVRELKPRRKLGRLPLFQVKFVFVYEPGPPLELPGLRAEPLRLEHCTAKFDLLLAVVDAKPGLAGFLEYNTGLMKADRIAHILEDFQTLLAHVAREPDTSIEELKKRLEEDTRRRNLRAGKQLKEVRHQRLKNVQPKSIRAEKG
jgi:hypothetical protein